MAHRRAKNCWCSPVCALLLALTALEGAWAAPEGVLAWVEGTSFAQQQVVCYDLKTDTRTVVGPGEADGAPRWSPDGTALAFDTGTPEGRGIYVARADGSGGMLIPAQAPWNEAPEWSADRLALAYTARSGAGSMPEVKVYDLESKEEQSWGGALGLDAADGALGLMQPIWLPKLRAVREAGRGFATSYALLLAIDPTQVVNWEGVDIPTLMTEAEQHGALLAVGVMQGAKGLNTEIFFVTQSQRVPILPLVPEQTQSFRYNEWNIRVDRSGAEVVYESNDGGDREIFVLNRRGITIVSNHRAADWHPEWDRRGNWLLVESFRHGRRGLYTIFPDTSRVDAVLVDDEAEFWHGVWAPDDKWIACVSDLSGMPQVYVAERDGQNLRRLSHSESGPHFYAVAPAWRPEVD